MAQQAVVTLGVGDLASIERVRNYTKSSTERLEAMAWCLRVINVDHVPGDVVEVGVWRAGNIMLARMVAPSRTCWLYDTYDGMTEPHSELDVKVNGAMNRAIDKYNSKKAAGRKWNAYPLWAVKQGFADVGVDMEQMHFVEGPVEETLSHSVPEEIAILRLDVDWYAPTKASLEVLYPRLAKGGFLIVDDYGHWLGCRKAVDDYLPAGLPFVDIDYTCRIYSKC